jgi:pimeloyl-ACP methyl ester carboxylesterase
MNTAHKWNEQVYRVPLEGGMVLEGNLNIPTQAQGVVLFAHGSGSSRHSPRNQFVAHILYDAGFATLLIDLLTLQEEAEDRFTGHLRFNIDLLSKRVVAVTNWLTQHEATKALKVACFGASTGAAAALVAAAEMPQVVGAVVSRGGRPDLAHASLPLVQAPTLLIVGSLDREVLELNNMAASLLKCERRVEVVAGATHLFEEPGALEQVARLASAWFSRYLSTGSPRE